MKNVEFHVNTVGVREQLSYFEAFVISVLHHEIIGDHSKNINLESRLLTLTDVITFMQLEYFYATSNTSIYLL